MMNTIAVLTVGCITLFTIIVIFVNQAECKAMTFSENKPQHIISKRNTWWSKKSMPMSGDLHRIAIDTISDREGNSNEELKQVFACYTNECVPDFVWCSQEAASRAEYLQCQVQHRLCSTRCMNEVDQAGLENML